MEKIKTNIQNLTCPNWWATEEIRQDFFFMIHDWRCRKTLLISLFFKTMCVPMNPWLTGDLKIIKYNLHYLNFQCILMQVILVIPWISNLVTLPLELVLQPHVHGVSKSTNMPVIMKIWLRKNININLWFIHFLFGCHIDPAKLQRVLNFESLATSFSQ